VYVGPFTQGMEDTRPQRSPSALDPWRDLQVGLATASSLQASIRHADFKAATLLTIEGAVAPAVIDRAAWLVGAQDPIVYFLAAVLLILLVTALVVATWQLVLAVRPQLTGVDGENRFAFPNIVRAGRRPRVVAVRQQRDEAWDLVSTLAHIAMAKHLRVRRSVPWFVMSIASAVCLMIVATLAAPMAS
jgi:hypothetical protein